MLIKKITVGPVQANCYILGCETTRKAAVIDPGDEAPRILEMLDRFGLETLYLLNTHGHFDHAGANREMKSATRAKICIHEADAQLLSNLSETAAHFFGMTSEDSPPADVLLKEGDTLTFGKVTLSILHTPGHTPGGVSFLSENAVFVGDTLFASSIGRTDLPGGDYATLQTSIRKKLFSLDDNFTVYPGHMEETTIGVEKRHNPFVRGE